MKEKFLIIDGSSLLHRAFYAIPVLTTRDGLYTNAVFGFTNMLLKLLEQEKPHYVMVAFDKGKITFRNELFPEYKGHRKATPPELKPQFSLMHEILDALNIHMFELDDYEADDLIGAFVQLGEAAELDTIIISGDKDVLQLISNRTRVLLTKKGISQMEEVDLSALQDRYNMSPEQIRDYKGLVGDPSDNIPGVPSVGDKTALKLLKEFNSMEGIYEHIDEIKGAKLKTNLLENKDRAFLSKRLATIECEVPAELSLDCCEFRKPDYPKLLNIVRRLEFNSLVNRFLSEMEPEPSTSVVKVVTADAFIKAYDSKEYLTLHLEVKLEKNQRTFNQAVLMQQDGAVLFTFEQEREFLSLMRQCTKGSLIVAEYKDAYKYLHDQDIYVNKVEDVSIAAYLLNPGRNNFSIQELALEYLNMAIAEKEGTEKSALEISEACQQLMNTFRKELDEKLLLPLFNEIEMPLTIILATMELEGIKVERKVLEDMGVLLEERIAVLTEEIYELAGENFNINSPKQLGIILFEKMDLPNAKKTKTGYSTNAEILEQLTHPIAEKLLTYRQLTKLKGTYVDGLKGLIVPGTGKIHTTFKQTITATGRLSSVEPNLQNIPIRMEEGRLLRKAFVPSQKKHVLLAADYSQIELRILAHLSEDENLLDAFNKGQDIHARTAAEVFGVPIDEVDSGMRRSAKAVNFGIIYGISDYGLSRDLGIARKDAKTYIDQYFERYHGVKKYIDNTIAEAMEKGYVTTLLNRRRYLPDLFSPNRMVRSFGERTAMNTPIQGSAADIIKIAMIRCDQSIQSKALPVKMLLQVHDELIFECPREGLEETAEIIRKQMEEAYSLRVPLTVDVKYGDNWYAMKRI